MSALHVHPSVIYTLLEQDEAILLHLETKLYYSLNETGRRIWELAADGHPTEQIASVLASEYEVSFEIAVAKTHQLLEELACEQLLIR
jgi:hypothetical protein